MTKENTYNGWANRETWLVNLHFDNFLQNEVEEWVNENEYDEDTNDKFVIADRLKETVESFLEEELEGLSLFLSDFIDLSKIEWLEIAENYLEDLRINN